MAKVIRVPSDKATVGNWLEPTAVAWAPPAPYPGLCWYYTDATQRSGFWDSCP